MCKIFVIFVFVMGGFALQAQDAVQPGTVRPSSQRLLPGTLPNHAVAAGVNQANGTPPEWRGADGFGKRLGDTVGSSSIAAGIGFALSTALHLDPRYYRCTTCGFWGHIGSAAK